MIVTPVRGELKPIITYGLSLSGFYFHRPSHWGDTRILPYAQGFGSGGEVDFRESLSALGQAILEPAHYGNRPDIAALIAAEEAAEAAASE